mmetsp:Transcript_15258/g.35796  ORF Transcript_15258/g.35796 Transcript_15258/m.35796 type:complete len:160 (+) Transcript_15258:100-579(+)|eukprot:CAMPEP_0172598570 /NCGR_PEP_ID=MMETSP1068-20121228/18617_1 /TAXON_ID=35684 /ORGANISM="Pseudopedinella elastica, Strain CCMP716" /LENGTH=159 /DNA_ID=CAMNT_0013398487 /DNA_START=236 /DNA_END=715 /DNA_ORIENTATION=-
MATTRRPRGPELSEDEKQELREAFELFDTERKGTVDLHELKVLMRALGFDVKKAEVVKYVHDVDPHNGGFVTFDQYLSLMTDRYGDRNPDDEMMKAFSLFDGDGSGTINVRNLRAVARELGETLTDDELQAMIDEFDNDQDGEIDAEEFISIMKQGSAY